MGHGTGDVAVSEACVLYDIAGSDHLPLAITLHISFKKDKKDSLCSQNDYKVVKYVDWDNLTAKEIE